jgi:hypothetical protein
LFQVKNVQNLNFFIFQKYSHSTKKQKSKKETKRKITYLMLLGRGPASHLRPVGVCGAVRAPHWSVYSIAQKQV